MTFHNYRSNTDNNQKEIVSALRKLGISVEVNHDDILCGHRARTYWYEIKNPQEIAKGTGKVVNRKSKTKDRQDRLVAKYKGHYKIVSTLDEILEDIKI